MNKPLIYIGAIRRSGSTMLCEALTQLPHSLVFNEPNIASDQFVIRAHEAALLRSIDIELEDFVRRWSIFGRRFLFRSVHSRLFPRLARAVAQIGIKEIFHANWRRIEAAFPDLRIVLTARDPRDIYLSLKSRYESGTAIWEGEFSPERVAECLNEEFSYQKQMQNAHTVFKVRYEDLCLDPTILARVLNFVGSEIDEVGQLGDFLRSDGNRIGESELHGGQITDKRVARWRLEPDGDRVRQACRVYELMPEFCDFWSYSE